MDEFVLTIGGRETRLRRSARLVGLRARPAGAPGLTGRLAEVPGPGQSGAKLGRPLGGFRLVELGVPRSGDWLDLLRGAPEVARGTHVYHTGAGQEVPVVPTGLIAIRFRPRTTRAVRQDLTARHGLMILEGRGRDGLLARVTRASRNPIAVAQALQADRAVRFAEPDLAAPLAPGAFAVPTDAFFDEQWQWRNTGLWRGDAAHGKAGADAGIAAAWAALDGFGSSEVTVAVLDDGFDLRHPDLAGKTIVAPWDFVRRSADVAPAGEADWHGTPCAGIAISMAGGGGLVGVAPAARFMPLRHGGQFSSEWVRQWFTRIRTAGADVVNCSFSETGAAGLLGTDANEAIAACAAQGAGGRGCVIVFAAGNDGVDIGPPRVGAMLATHPAVVTVAACDSLDRRAPYSNFGNAIWLAAPSAAPGAWAIRVADVTGTLVEGGEVWPAGLDPGDYSLDFAGTSAAAPVVAGVVALMRSARPDLSAARIKALLAKTARPIDGAAPANPTPMLGHGCVDAAAAVRAARQG